MDTNTVLILMGIGLMAGIASGFIGIGGGIVIVPALIYFLGLTQHQAQGMSLLLMLPPIGILAVVNYYKATDMTPKMILYAGIMAAVFIVGGYIGSKLSLQLNAQLVKLIFGLLMFYVSIRMIVNGSSYFWER
jgi:uncharacterized membrane protein YfcA